MLKKRIIPTLLWDGVQCVKPVGFERPYRKLGPMEQYIQVMERRSIDELIIIDIEATNQEREPNYGKLRAFCDNLYCPVTYGGGINSLDCIAKLLENGADKVCIKTRLDIIEPAARKFGSQAIVYALDIPMDAHTHGINRKAVAAENRGAGEILATKMNYDGTMRGYDLQMATIVPAVNIPVIFNGGCGEPQDMEKAFNAGASAVAAGSMFLYTDHTPRSCAKYLAENKIAVRV